MLRVLLVASTGRVDYWLELLVALVVVAHRRLDPAAAMWYAISSRRTRPCLSTLKETGYLGWLPAPAASGRVTLAGEHGRDDTQRRTAGPQLSGALEDALASWVRHKLAAFDAVPGGRGSVGVAATSVLELSANTQAQGPYGPLVLRRTRPRFLNQCSPLAEQVGQRSGSLATVEYTLPPRRRTSASRRACRMGLGCSRSSR